MTIQQKSFHTYFFYLAFLFLVGFFTLTLIGSNPWSGWILMSFFLSLSVAFRGNQVLKGFVFTSLILAAVSMAMYYPTNFQKIGDFKTTLLVIPAMQIIMFGMGTELSIKDFTDVLRMPKAVIVGIVCHYTIMPLMGFAMAKLFNFPDEIAAGIILVGCCPSGLASNVMCFLARANLALSVTVTALSTLVAPIFTPLLMKLLAGKLIEVNILDMVMHITEIVIIPIIAGLIFHYVVRGKFKWLDKAMPYFSMFGIGIVLVVISADKYEALKQVGLLLLVATALHNLFGFLLGYWSARMLKFPEKDSRTIALEVGMQNAGMAAGLAIKMGVALAGLAPAVFAVIMNLSGSILANWWHHRDPDIQVEKPERVAI